MNIAFIGYGNVGAPLADRLQRLGHNVTLAVKDQGLANVRGAMTINPWLELTPPRDAVKAADMVFLATPY